jgi:prevent-host-death family protein
MERIGVRELRQHASRYLARVANGEPIEVTDRGRPVARLVPVPSGESALAELIGSGRLKAPESDSDLEEPGDFGIDATARLAEMRADER